ncbi:hypothetical protein [Draconibacterium orientale]|jgi:hypothetical protein|uniref:hypothetical protein n=1 Tax=Draconibacterium orientale TaxID=1168034 RepID=UPI002A0A4850|nr:hypothetical protein [Draconibacterium orientale]
MTAREKKRKAAMIAVAYYLEQEAAKNNLEENEHKAWAAAGKELIMDNRQMVQRHGRLRKRA